MSKKIQCKKAGKRAQFRTSSKFRQKVFQHKRQIVSRDSRGFGGVTAAPWAQSVCVRSNLAQQRIGVIK